MGVPSSEGWPPLLLWGRSLAGFLAAALIVADMCSVLAMEAVPSQVIHIGLCLLVASRRLPTIVDCTLCMYLTLASCLVRAYESVIFIYGWRIFRLLAWNGAYMGCCCSFGKGCLSACSVVHVAIIVQIGLTVMPCFIAEDVLPYFPRQMSLVETPEFRKEVCANATYDPAARVHFMCDRRPLLSWDEAEKEAAAVLAKMTSEERHLLMRGLGWNALSVSNALPLPAIPKRGYYMGNTAPIPHLGVPPLKLHDAGNGFRNMPWPLGVTGTTIMWPSSLAMGATWDVDLVERAAEAIGREYRGKGANVILGPSVQVHRTARNGRNFEYMSGEDPYLGAKLTFHYVRGVQREGVMACLKHYGFNDQETNRNWQNSIVDERTAWEIYYPPFEAGVEAGAGSVMCSYNVVNGTYACSNEELLARDLKGKMGFRGFVMSDWWALQEPAASSTVRGFDQEMPGAGGKTWLYHDKLDELEQSKGGNYSGHLGLDKDKLYDDPALRVLAATWKLRLHERPGCIPGRDCVPAIDSDQRTPENQAVAQQLTTQSVMLLQNDGVLPIKASNGVKTVALIGFEINAPSKTSGEVGMTGDFYSGGGSGHCFIRPDQLTTVLDRFLERAASDDIKLLHSDSNSIPQAEEIVTEADVAVVLVSASAGESIDRDDLHVSMFGDDLVRAVAKKAKRTVVMVQSPGIVLMPWRDEVAAVAMMFLGGEYSAHAWASVIFGDVSPSGRLPIVIPKTAADVIEPGTETDVKYDETLFSSYRARNAKETSAFPFGHGLSYTEFDYGVPKQLPKERCEAFVCVKVAVLNRGKVPGAEVVQAYLEFPPEAEEPPLVLRGFRRTAELQPEGTEQLQFDLRARDFSIYKHGGWQLQTGKFRLHFGSSSADIRQILHNIKFSEEGPAP
eukprot:CAMPEP_0179246514 /NCGR_PEP_ID=MMETSP0797-20121207/19134_1 /TAXON_ID=47934 /ORGANISM="Dinophysis acuminata, Strain DAEP01" /LENGTH=900 /DNA_ID=CAMNT_0020954107 /DNA_START=1 /DNA_END=2703 /DNA_ORIENTATION=+